jgi:hypothetical protein
LTTKKATLLVASAEGLLYEFAVEGLAAGQEPRSAQTGEWALLGSEALPG